ncbi:Palmitoyltransferase ZDHHC13 [Collichthys lucidus]|uniref:Palmitoyltransferase n=1 Tax=Collichthys lucidus TaxID=240159 RepID=A0A4U5UBB6_COLLU|nr:Palmitoyltransferase ZDHHC13 [Collichthys lucidus]
MNDKVTTVADMAAIMTVAQIGGSGTFDSGPSSCGNFRFGSFNNNNRKMHWSEDDDGHGSCHHGHGGHSHSHGPRAAHPFMTPFHGQFAKSGDQAMNLSQQPKKRSHMGDSSSWDIVKASQFGILERCKELVEAGYDVRQPDKENVTLLHWAAINNRSELVNVSDENTQRANRADMKCSDSDWFSAVSSQEVDGPDCNGQTPLMLAAQKIIGPEPTNFLIKNNASVSAVDKVNRNTPLHCAVLAGNVDAAHILLEAGASVDAENINGQTPIDLAHQVHSPLLVHMLNHIKQERIRSSSRCLRLINRYRVFLQFLLCTAVFGSVGAIVDMNSESWLLKGILLACVIGVINVASSATVQVLFTFNAITLLYYYLRTCRTDPGFVKATEEEKKMTKKPMRTNHCFSCDACGAKQDHHSVWTNSCIGARNHHYFILFLFSLMLMGAWMFYGCLKYWTTHCVLHYEEQGLWGVVSGLVSCSPWVLAIFLLAFYHTCWSGLVLVLQLYQIAFLGLTTAERTSLMLHQRKLRQSVSLRQNPYNLGVVRNLVSFFQLRCCGLFKPAVIDWTQQFPPGRDQPMFGHMDLV